ncbi:MAG: hypothetical protein F4Z24_04150 [Nitrospira sp. SB0666_bin_27]|nr:hypothetical protein [Nitrospira sp. SB0666_bin_27]
MECFCPEHKMMEISSQKPRSTIPDPGIPMRAMTGGVLGIILASGCLFMNLSAPSSSQAQDVIVDSIAIAGNQRIESAAILGNVTLKTGDPLSPQATQQQIRRIYDMGFFDDVQVQTETTAKGVAVTFVVQEKPFVTAIVFDGYDALSDDKLK